MEQQQNGKKSNLECKAWRLNFPGFHHHAVIIRSDTTRSKARYKEWVLAKRYHPDFHISDIRVIRAKDYDHLAIKPEIIGGSVEEITWGCLAQ
jgi:hypothetical protein